MTRNAQYRLKIDPPLISRPSRPAPYAVYPSDAPVNLNNKSLESRLNGRFYTHELIGKNLSTALAELLCKRAWQHIKIIEPFCGDGRLVSWLLESLDRARFQRTVFDIQLWDNDPVAVDLAAKKIAAIADKLKYKAKISFQCVDSFLEAPKHFRNFDVCITNPPWENLKPDRRELEQLTEVQKAAYISNIRKQADLLDSLYTEARPSKKFSGWGTNLSKCGTEVSLTLLKPDGIGGLVLPSTIWADQVSEGFRSWVFNNYRVEDLSYYAAEARLFEKVDQPVVTAICAAGSKTEQIPQRIYSFGASHTAHKKEISEVAWREIRSNGYSLPANFNFEPLEILSFISAEKKFKDLEGSQDRQLWAGRELDETGRQRFVSPVGTQPFIKGRNIKRFGMAGDLEEFLTENAPTPPKSVGYHRIVWRDVARHSQKRRMHAAIIPPGWVTGNSLNVAHYRDDDTDRLYALLGIMNSLTFEAMCRMFLATGHVSLGAVRKVPVPALENKALALHLSALAKKVCAEGEGAELLLDIEVAKSYGVTKEVFKKILSVFDKIDDETKSAYMQSSHWN